ncbi:probable transposase [Roseobacter sp. SK209-2-6]|nr:probable transposase [Roseobacter sp. SK209-2-6]
MRKPEPARYRTTNWKSYNDALTGRGSLLIWLDKDLVWQAPKGRSQGSPCCVFRCSDPVLFDGENTVRPAAEANRTTGTPLVRVTMARRSGVQHPEDGRVGLACAGFSTQSRHQNSIIVQMSGRHAAGSLNLLIPSRDISGCCTAG